MFGGYVFGNLNYIAVILAILFSMFGSLLATFYNTLINKKRIINISFSNLTLFLIISSTFSISNAFLIISTNHELDTFKLSGMISGYMITSWLLIIGSYSFLNHITFRSYISIIPSSILAFVLVAINSIFYLIIFSSNVQLKPLHLLICFLLTVGFFVSVLKFWVLLKDGEENLISKKWRIVWSIITGFSYVIISFSCFLSVVNLSSINNTLSMERVGLLLLIIMCSANLLMMIITDLLADLKLIESRSNHIKNHEHLKSLFNYNPDAVFSMNLKGIIVSVNKEAPQLTGYRNEELIGMYFSRLVKREQLKQFIQHYQNVITGKEDLFEGHLVKKNRDLSNVKINFIPVYFKEDIIGFYGIVKDVTDTDLAQETINYLAYHDELTRLPNRRLYIKKLYQLKNKGHNFAIMNLDFDRFKRLNDLFGHAFGDQVLVEIAKRLQQSLGEKFFIARMGGDEFCVIVTAEEDIRDISALAELVLDQFRVSLRVKRHECLITASIGIALFPAHSDEIEALVKYADIAMYEAKENGANQYKIYNNSLKDKTIEKIKLENDLRYALSNNQLSIYYQPKFHAKTKKIIGAEALLRWHHPKIGTISPDRFIPIAEETGLIIPLEEWVLQSVCQQIKLWKTNHCYYGRTSVNISHLHIYKNDLVETITRILDEFQLDPSCLEVEITESTMINNENDTNRTLMRLRELGIEVSMDDFGTGYSSLGYLNKLSIDRVKIDKSFIKEMYKNEAIVSTIISMAKHLELKVIAEGVETDEQLKMVSELGCLEIQGFYFSKPLCSEEFENKILRSLTS
ncbi:sensor domain-containing protein [Litchfieldia alkalitelluris]|uniref:sensor domain-containing protein n=1 Tax=Litchfieldia alkalitelluris TaxID=304268 RepID=UPI0009977C93|nr:EAL domain-containing protein [Litchfieldia alkalitelluris]